MVRNEEFYLYHNDPNSCPSRLLDESGKVVWAARYDAWGKVKKLLVDEVDQPLRLQGQYFDGETGLHYNRFRYYCAEIGSFVSQDPLGLVAGENVYSFGPNTQKWIDPLGLCKSCPKLKNAVKTKKDTAFFWSGRTDGIGGKDRALEIARQKGGTTLEGLLDSKGIKLPEWDIDNPASIKAWEDVSAMYANQVSGEVRAVVGAELRTGNVWQNVELPRLMSNPNVTKITTIDPKTLTEKVVSQR